MVGLLQTGRVQKALHQQQAPGIALQGFTQCWFPCPAMQPVVCLAWLGSPGCSSSQVRCLGSPLT